MIRVCHPGSLVFKMVVQRMVPKWQAVHAYYREHVHKMLLPKLDTKNVAKFNDAERLEYGMDQFWSYLVHREVSRMKLPTIWYWEDVWVSAGRVLFLPAFYLHSSGRHPAERGYSIRAHAYISNELELHGEVKAGTIYDFRGDRKLAPLVTYLKATGDRINM